jgi:hypothetical protein
MKLFYFHIRVIMLVHALFVHNLVEAQLILNISDELLATGEQIQIKSKSGFGFRFIFDIYEMSKYNQGPTESISKSPRASAFEETYSEAKSSFYFMSSQGHSSVINIYKNTVHRGYDDQFHLSLHTKFGSISKVFGSEEVFENTNKYNAIISITSESTLWSLILIEQYGTEVEGAKGFSGWLTNGDRFVEILPIFTYQNKKGQIKQELDLEDWMVKGFEFREDNKAIGAVQLGPFPRFFAWFAQDLDAGTRFMLAASYSALLSDFMLDIN